MQCQEPQAIIHGVKSILSIFTQNKDFLLFISQRLHYISNERTLLVTFNCYKKSFSCLKKPLEAVNPRYKRYLGEK